MGKEGEMLHDSQTNKRDWGISRSLSWFRSDSGVLLQNESQIAKKYLIFNIATTTLLRKNMKLVIGQDNVFYDSCNMPHTSAGAVPNWIMSHPKIPFQLEILLQLDNVSHFIVNIKLFI